MLKKLLPKARRERRTTERSRPRRNSRATVTIVGRMVISIFTVILQESTKKKKKE